MVPGWLAADRGRTADGIPLSVQAINLARGNEVNSEEVLAEIRRSNPDVLFLSEVTPAWHARLAPALVDFPFRHVTADPGYFGVALYSRLPLRDAATIPLAYDWAPAVRAVVATPAGPLGVLGVHAPRPGRVLAGGRRSPRGPPGGLHPPHERRRFLRDLQSCAPDGARRVPPLPGQR